MTITDQAKKWYALNVRSRQEQLVSRHLSALGEEQFFPVKPVASNGRVTQETPLFPGYVFCRVDWNSGPKLYTVPGIIKVLSVGKTPISIPEDEIEAVRALVSSGMRVRSVPLVQCNTPVVVHGGPLQGVKGMVIGERNAQSLIISVPLLRRSLAVVLDRSWLAPQAGNNAA